VGHDPPGWRPIAIHALLLVIVLVGLFPTVFFAGEMIAPGDLLFLTEPWSQYGPDDFVAPQNPLMPDIVTAFFPYYYLTRQAFDGGEWPLWNPLQYAGMPLLANAQSAVFYPPRLLHLLFDIPTATTLYILLKLWLCGMSAFICAVGLRLPLAAARFFSFAWMLCAYNIIWPNWSLPDVSVWLPILFLGVERLLEERLRSGVLLVAIGGLFLLLAGHPETAFAMSLGIGVYFGMRLLLDRRRGGALWRPVAGASLGWLLALLVAAPQLLPFAEYLLNSSTFFDRPEESYSYVYPASALTGLWAPRFFGAAVDGNYYGSMNSNLYMMIYPGIAVWALLGLLLWRTGLARHLRNRMLALGAVALWGVAVAFAFSWFEAVHRLPVFSSMIEAYHITATVFALPLLATHAVASMLRAQPQRGDVARAWVFLGLGAVILLWAYWWFRPYVALAGDLPYLQQQLLVAALFALLSGAALTAWASRRLTPRQATALVTVVLVLDLFYNARSLNPTMPKSQVYPETALTETLRALPNPTRIGVGEAGIPSGIMSCYGIEDWLAYDGLYPARMVRFQTGLGPAFWEGAAPAAAIPYYLHNPGRRPLFPKEESPERFALVGSYDGIEIYRFLDAFPRAYVIGGIDVVPDDEALLTRMREEGFDPSVQVLAAEHETLTAAGALPDGQGFVGSADITDYAMTSVSLTAEADAPGILVLADAWYPGWKAYLNGAPVPLFPVFHVFRGIVLPEAGAYQVEYVYRPGSFRAGMAVSVVALLGSLLVLLVLVRRDQEGGTASAR